MKQRIYIVRLGEGERLVRASHPQVALMYIAREVAAVRVADQDSLVRLLAAGAAVECAAGADATPSPQTELQINNPPRDAATNPQENPDVRAAHPDAPEGTEAQAPRRRRGVAAQRIHLPAG
jgi:hypothetical protein